MSIRSRQRAAWWAPLCLLLLWATSPAAAQAPHPEAGADPGSETDSDSDADSDSGADAAADAGADSDAVADADAGADAGADADAVAEADAGAVAEADSGADAGTDAGTDAEATASGTSTTATIDELDGGSPSASSDSGFESAFDDEFADLDGYLGEHASTWNLDDGEGEGEPWQDYDPPYSYQGRSLARVGLQLRVAGLPGGKPPVPEGPLGELGFVFDTRYSAFSAWHFRAVLAVSAQNVGRAYEGGGAVAVSSPFAIRLRLLPVAFDAGEWLTLRLGPDIGIQWAEESGAGGTFEVLFGTLGEVALRLLDERLEVAVHGGFQFTAVGRVTRFNFGRELVPQGVLGGSVAWLFD